MGKLIQKISVVSTVISVGLFLAGTAAAGAMAFPKQAQRLSRILETEGRQVRVQLGEAYQQVRGLLDVAFDTGGGAGGNHRKAGDGGPAGQARPQKASLPASPRRHAPQHDDPPGQRIYGLNNSGSVIMIAGTQGGPSLSEGAQSGGEKTRLGENDIPAAPLKPDRPAATPIPGAFWLLGSGLAVLFAAKRAKRSHFRST